MFFSLAARKRLHRPSFARSQLRTGGARRKLLVFLVLLVATVAILPWVVTQTPLRNTLLNAVVPRDALRITASGGSFSWKNGASLSGIEVRDAAGDLLLVAEKISIDRAPGNLLMHPRDLGNFEIHRPTLYLKTRPDGSNLEDVAQKLLSSTAPDQSAPAANETKPPFALAVYVTEGTILAQDTASGRQWQANKLDVRYNNRGAGGGPGIASASGELLESRDGKTVVPAGKFAASLKTDDAGKNQLTFDVTDVSLTIAGPWLRRFEFVIEAGGRFSANATASWSTTTGAAASDLQSAGMLTIDNLDATAPGLQGDRIKLSRVELPWRCSSQPGGIAVEECQLRSDVGQVALRGRLDPTLAAERHDLELRGSIDAARLAAMLPRALSLREGITITSGTVKLAGRCQPVESAQVISCSVRMAELSAANAGRPIRWDEPIDANFAMRRGASGIQLDTLKCDSKFLRVDASGTPQQLSANLQFDFNSLAEQLGQFVNLSGIQLAGTGDARLEWRQAADNRFTATATGNLAQVSVSLPDGSVLAEPQLAIRGDASGSMKTTSWRPARIDSAKLNVSGQGDVLHAQVANPVDLASDTPLWPLSLRASGRIARWLARVRPWVAPGAWQIDGQSEFTSDVRIAGAAIEATNTQLTISDLRATAPGWSINEPRVEFAGDARWDGSINELSSSTAQLVTSTVSLAMKDVRFRASGQTINQLNGVAAFRADLARLAAWRASAAQPPEYRPGGELSGNIRFAQQADRIAGEITATGQNLVLTSRSPASAATPAANRSAVTPGAYQAIWQEPQLTLRGLASYQPATDRLAFEQLQIQSNTLQAAAGGAIDKLSTAADVNMTGTLNYDLAQVTPLLRPYIGSGVQLAGREQARFAVTGKLSGENSLNAQLADPSPTDPYRLATAASAAPSVHWSHRIRAQLELPWSGANVYGLPIGAGRLAANLGDGAIRFEPLSLAVGEGQLTAAPHLRFDPQPAQLSLPAGPLITNVRISPEVSEAMLKYVAPVLAGTTQSEGQFSMQLDGTRIPLAEARRADAAGRLTVHSVRVVPGPMARELIGLAQQIEALAKRRDPTALAARSQVTLLAIRDQQVNFRVVEGRVHHQNMEFQIDDVTVRSQGSVGFDETLNLTLQVPIQEAWVSKEPLLAGLKGQALQIPMTGTLTRPQMDQRAVASLSQQLLQGAAQQAIGGELNKALDKLFKSR
jgi:hypothetical protein